MKNQKFSLKLNGLAQPYCTVCLYVTGWTAPSTYILRDNCTVHLYLWYVTASSTYQEIALLHLPPISFAGKHGANFSSILTIRRGPALSTYHFLHPLPTSSVRSAYMFCTACTVHLSPCSEEKIDWNF